MVRRLMIGFPGITDTIVMVRRLVIFVRHLMVNIEI